MISHDYKFIFVKINKTAGTSVANTLKGSDPNCNEAGHSTIRELTPDQRVRDYFKFTFVRNPWDRLVSIYYYRRPWLRVPDRKDTADWRKLYFKHWVGQLCTSRLRRVGVGGSPTIPPEDSKFTGQQVDWIIDKDGNIDMDFIGRFENLQNDFDTICGKIGIPSETLPHLRKNEHDHYSECYDDETKRIVAKKFQKDIETFGYEF